MTDSTSISQIDPKVWFWTVCRKNGLELTDTQLDLFGRFANLLLEWNRRVNLVSRKDEANVWQAHLLHSVSILMRVVIPAGQRVLDLGTGGGLPGIPIKICRPDLAFTLLDATKKKLDAVTDMIRALGLPSVQACWGRAEDVGKQAEHAHRYDLVIARAVAPLSDLVKWSQPFLRSPLDGTRLIALKGGDLVTEIRHARNLPGVKNVSTVELELTDSSEFLASDKKILVVDF